MRKISAAVLFLVPIATAAGAQTFVGYNCADGSVVAAAFYRGEKRAHLQVDGQALTLPQRISASGARYAKRGVSFWIKGQEATLKRPGKPRTACRAQ